MEGGGWWDAISTGQSFLSNLEVNQLTHGKKTIGIMQRQERLKQGEWLLTAS